MMLAEGTTWLDVLDDGRVVGSVRMEAITRLIAPEEHADVKAGEPVPVSEDAAGG